MIKNMWNLLKISTTISSYKNVQYWALQHLHNMISPYICQIMCSSGISGQYNICKIFCWNRGIQLRIHQPISTYCIKKQNSIHDLSRRHWTSRCNSGDALRSKPLSTAMWYRMQVEPYRVLKGHGFNTVEHNNHDYIASTAHWCAQGFDISILTVMHTESSRRCPRGLTALPSKLCERLA